MNNNPKIDHLLPGGGIFERCEWAQKRGVSPLYDAPEGSYTDRNGRQFLKCDLSSPALLLYRRLADICPPLDAILSDLQPCWLDPTSYHSTFANSVNQFNLHEIKDETVRAKLSSFLEGLPGSLNREMPQILPPLRFCEGFPWKVRLRFDRLHVWPKAHALVALLKPADPKSAATLDAIRGLRPRLNEKLVRSGLAADEGPTEHVSLCYFPTREEAVAAKERLGVCLQALPDDLGELMIEFTSISLYAWTSMVEFWPAHQFTKWDSPRYGAQTDLIEHALTQPDHSLETLLHLMRANHEASIYLFGKRLDSKYCFGSDSAGLLLSVLPDDRKAGIPGYHPGSTEVYSTFAGSLTMDILNRDTGEVVSKKVSGADVCVIAPGACHRVRDAAKNNAASMIMKTNLSHRPEVVRCDQCTYFAKLQDCPMNLSWEAEKGAAGSGGD